MMAIFSDMVEKSIEIFMDDFIMIDYTFDECCKNLKLVLKKCMETNLVLNSEKMPLYGEKRHSVEASHFRKRD